MSIKWGSDLTGIPLTKLVPTGAADVTCTAGSFVSALSVGGIAGALVQATAQDFIASIKGVMAFTFGASAPTALEIIYATTAGTAIDSYLVTPTLLVALTVILVPIYLVGASSSVLFGGAGATPLVQVKATTNACTMTAVGSVALFGMGLGND